VKICGVTRPEDARLAVDLGAAAIGMVFWPASPRAIDVGRAREIVDALPPFVTTVGVFVNQTDEAPEIARAVGLNVVQLHGDEPPESYRDMAVRTIKAIGVSTAASVDQAARVPARTTVLLDAHDPIRRGGTGRPIDWSIADAIARQRPVILSGGLNPGNLLLAIDAVRPMAIDVSSGGESAPGIKDPVKLRELFDALRHSSIVFRQSQSR
jgi:phosphoribosylanthranilate isomerase